jgi:predicted glycoside hydrolase/deacetylase ChbG (UPF0249 family)
MRAIVLSADDYGLAPGVGAAIRELAAQGRLSATACMTPSPDWPEEARRLAPLADGIDIGLHLTLTGLAPLTGLPGIAEGGRAPGLGGLAARAWTGRLDPGVVAREIEAQIDAFVGGMGRLPDFIDGHHHVHRLPGVRGALFEVIARRFGPGGVRVRECGAPIGATLRHRVAFFRAQAIDAMGRGFRAAAEARGIPLTGPFLGVRAFSEREDFGALMARWLAAAPDGALIMCHPGHVDAALAGRDRLTAPREAEYRYLSGPEFAAALAAAGARLARLDGRPLLYSAHTAA